MLGFTLLLRFCFCVWTIVQSDDGADGLTATTVVILVSVLIHQALEIDDSFTDFILVFLTVES